MSSQSSFFVSPEIIETVNDLSDEEVKDFAALHKNASNAADWEIYLLCQFMLSVRINSREQDNVPLMMDQRRTRLFLFQDSARLAFLFQQTREMKHIDSAIDLMNEALVTTPNEYPPAFHLYANLGAWYGFRHEVTKALDDLNHAIKATSAAAELIPLNDDLRPKILYNRMSLLSLKHGQTCDKADLDLVITATDTAVRTDITDRSQWLGNLYIYLSQRYQLDHDIQDLNRMVEANQMRLELEEANELGLDDLASCWNGLGYALATRAAQTSSMSDLDDAIDAACMAAQFWIDPMRKAAEYSSLGNKYIQRYERTGEEADLDLACDYCEEAVKVIPSKHELRADALNNLSTCLSARFLRTSKMETIDRAIEVSEEAVREAGPYHEHSGLIYNTLGRCFTERFDWTNALEDLDNAINATKKALDSHIRLYGRDLAMTQSNLANMLGRRFNRKEETWDLDDAIETLGQAVNNTRSDDPDKASWLASLGAWLGRRFEVLGNEEDLDRAIEVTAITIDPDTPVYSNQYPGYLNNMGIWLYRRFEERNDIKDLDRAIDLARMAVRKVNGDHPEYGQWINNLGIWLQQRFRVTEVVKDLEDAISSFKDGYGSKIAAPSVRIRCARKAATLLASQTEWISAYELLRDAVHLLPKISPRSIRHSDKESALGWFAGLASMAAAMALKAGVQSYKALELLELGRGVISNLLLDMRSDVSDLKEQHPDLAQEFISLRNMLDTPTPVTGVSNSSSYNIPLEMRARQRREADERLEELIKTIRNKSGFRNFLLPPTEAKLMAAADPDPIIVINLSTYGCSAFLIERNRIRVLDLPKLHVSTVKNWTQRLGMISRSDEDDYSEMLEWLWDVVASPCLEELEFTKTQTLEQVCPRVWWIPTGSLGQLPLHAAGKHSTGKENEAVLDRVMSSYALSVKSLIYSRQKRTVSNRPPSEVALLVAMEETPGLGRPLYYAESEVSMVSSICSSMKLKPKKLDRRLRDEVLARLADCSVFHFAGHGHSHPTSPSSSSLLLADWNTNPLTVNDLREHRLQDKPPFLGYLSACSTGANESAKLADESIHLIGALQIAGFRHVIGTLWEVEDHCCVDVARVLYETLRDEGMNDRAVCVGLHRAVKALRGMEVEGGDGRNVKVGVAKTGYRIPTRRRLYNYSWVPYVHFGALAPLLEPKPCE